MPSLIHWIGKWHNSLQFELSIKREGEIRRNFPQRIDFTSRDADRCSQNRCKPTRRRHNDAIWAIVPWSSGRWNEPVGDEWIGNRDHWRWIWSRFLPIGGRERKSLWSFSNSRPRASERSLDHRRIRRRSSPELKTNLEDEKEKRRDDDSRKMKKIMLLPKGERLLVNMKSWTDAPTYI